MNRTKPRRSRRRPHTLVVGGTRGIGRAIVKAFARQGHKVSVIGRRSAESAGTRSANIDRWSVDLVDGLKLPAALSDIVAANGRIDHLIFLQRYRGPDDAWRGELEVSLTATKTIIERLANKFRRGADGSIVIISSHASRLVAAEQPVGYHVAKAALEQMARYYAWSLGPDRIRVNCVTPGTVLKEESRAFYLGNKPLLELYRQITPLGRMGTTEDIAQAVLFLCSPQAAFITGQNIVVDGGISLQWQEGLARKLTRLDQRRKPKRSAGGRR